MRSPLLTSDETEGTQDVITTQRDGREAQRAAGNRIKSQTLPGSLAAELTVLDLTRAVSGAEYCA